MLYGEFKKLNFLKEIDIFTPEGRENATEVINNCTDSEAKELLLNVPNLTEEDLVNIFRRFSTEKYCWILGENIATHPNFNLNVLNRILNETTGGCLKNKIFVAAAKSTEDEGIYNALYSLGKKTILNACKKNTHFTFNEFEMLSEENKLIIFMLNSGDISEDTGFEMIDKFDLPSIVIKTMFKMNSKWREYILGCKKLNFGSVNNQLMLANDSTTDEETLYELSIVAKNPAVKKAILAHHNCTLEIARNMFK